MLDSRLSRGIDQRSSYDYLHIGSLRCARNQRTQAECQCDLVGQDGILRGGWQPPLFTSKAAPQGQIKFHPATTMSSLKQRRSGSSRSGLCAARASADDRPVATAMTRIPLARAARMSFSWSPISEIEAL